MTLVKLQKTLLPIVTLIAILFASAGLILYGRGYRLDFTNNSLKPTGLISATSDPVGAQIFVDGKLKTATNNSFSIDPGWYTVTISKDGFISWQKRIRVQGEVAARADAFLFPTNPSLSPLTTTGVENPILSPDGARIAYTVPFPKDPFDVASRKKAGLWTYELSEGPLGRNRDPQQLDASSTDFDFGQAQMVWSPNSKQILVVLGTVARLYDISKPNVFTNESGLVETTLASWQEDNAAKLKAALSAFPQPVIDVSTSSAKIVDLSPDESKILYEATASATLPMVKNPPLIGTNSTPEERNISLHKFYIYDAKEDKNYLLLEAKELVEPTPATKKVTLNLFDQYLATQNKLTNLFWFPTSRHLILAQKGKIDILEYDRTNWITVYAGPFVDSFVAPWPNGSRIVILTNLNPGVSTLPNLYTINLR